VKKISSVFSEDFINEQGRESGFIQRASKKVTAVKFLDLLLYNCSQVECQSLNRLAINGKEQCDIEISKQGLDQRTNNRAIVFLRSLLQKQFKNQISENLETRFMENFNRICIKDSTKYDIHEQLSEWLPGFGGCASSASACIQYEFDLKSGNVLDLDLTPGNHPDAKDAQQKSGSIMKDDLIIRDLGYFSLDVLSDILDAEAYFLTRLNFKTTVYEQIEDVLIELNFEKLYLHMEKYGISKMEKHVLIGRDDKLPVRLIIERMPDQIYEKRIGKIKAQNHKKGYSTTNEYKQRSRFNLFVTNANEKKLSAKAIPLFYKIRWQVELIFKVWKSNFGIHITRKMKIERFLCLLYAKLLLIMVNWEIIQVNRNSIYKTTGKLLSIDKCFKTLKDHANKFRQILQGRGLKIEELLHWINNVFESKHWLEKRKNKMCFEEILNIIY
jgi:hypothetical protein